MNPPTDFDIGPLTWVKNEIDLALDRADGALQTVLAEKGKKGTDVTPLKFCRTHLHQVQGALAVVGLDGATHFVEALESLLEAVEQGQRPGGAAALTIARRAIAGVRHFLDDLMSGQPNQPMRLMPLYREIQSARGHQDVSPSDLFFPDLRVRPPRRASSPPRLGRSELLRRLRQQRTHYQRGFLSWLRSPQERAGIRDMLDAVKVVEGLQDAPSARSFWWVATAFLTALAERTLPPDADSKQLCTRIDLQMRRLIEGSNNVAERLMRDALYLVRHAESKDRLVTRVQEAYQLASLMPSAAEPPPVAATETIRRRLREVITSTEEAWNKYCAGTVQALPAFRNNANTLATIVEGLDHQDLLHLVDAVVEVGNLLAALPSRHSDALAMETATAILLAQHASENLSYLDESFSHQVKVMVERIHSCLAGTPPPPESELPSLDEMSRRAQEKLLTSQVAKEIQNNLLQVEQALDSFFRDPEKRTDLKALEPALKQVMGALTMMRQDAAAAVVVQCTAEILQFAEAKNVPSESDFEHVAERLSLLGFFVDALQHGATDFEAYAANLRGETRSESLEEESAGTVEQEVEQQKREAHALLVALKEQPSDAVLRQEVQQNLAALQQDADLVADAHLGRQTKDVLSALATGSDAARQIDEAMAALKPLSADAPGPSPETLQLSQASSAEVDAELLEIFLEEAQDVLGSMDKHFRLLKQQPHDVDVLTAIRRSVHTLKGSGRMVGLKDLGETAWSIEQVLNLWLRREEEVTPALFGLIEQAYGVFLAWIECLRSGCGLPPDPAALIARADAFRQAGERAAEADTKLADASARTLAVPSQSDVRPLETPRMSEAVSSSTRRDSAKGVGKSGKDRRAQPRLSLAPGLAEIFNDEARTHLTTLQRELSTLETDPSAPTTHEMYRAAHTLAGIAGTVGIEGVNKLSRALEQALVRRNLAKRKNDSKALDTIRQAIATLSSMLADVTGGVEPEPAHSLVHQLDKWYPEVSTAPASPEPDTDRRPPVTSASPAAADKPPAVVGTIAAEIAQVQDELDEQLLPLFIEEALDLIQNVAAQIHAWRSSPADRDVMRRLARLFHTLKGSARMAGAMNLGELTHAIETRMDMAQRRGEASMDLIEDVDNAFEIIVRSVDRLQRGEAAHEAPRDLAEAAAPKVIAQAAAPQAGAHIVVPGERAVAGGPPDTSEFDGEAGTQRATLRVRADLIDRLVNEAGELSIARSRIEGEMRAIKASLLDLTENVIRLRRQLRDIEFQAETQMQSRTAQTGDGNADFDPLEFDRFTRFQELTRMMAESVNDVATVQQNLLKNLDDANAAILAQARLNREVQQELMSVRMVPFGNIAERLYRNVRQAAKEVGKRANLEIRGTQLEVDRTVLEKMLAPLEHMLRNAVAHGLEETPVRLAKGKPEIGEISLTLAQEGNEIILNFADDGAGLDLDRLRERGLATGLLTPEEADDPARVVDLIFAPGISTASEVSQLSGRGIGMDVLKSEVSSLGGRIEVFSTTGQGTTFRLYLPLTLAVTKALLVRSGSREYAIPSAMIEQVLDLREKGLARIREANSAVWAEHHYPFHYLPQLLGDQQAIPETHPRYWVLLLRSGTSRTAVQVDGVLGNQEIVVKNIGQQLARVIGVDGATVLGNGQVVLILNPVALASRGRVLSVAAPAVSQRATSAGVLASAIVPTIMVVDDSLTVRKITSRLLAREGYQVNTAKNGVEALEQLATSLPDVMLVDIEMPRMDGFELTRNVRADQRLRHIPIIMITSRTAEKHRQYAFELGVNHYLGKPYQEDELLRLVASHVKEQRRA